MFEFLSRSRPEKIEAWEEKGEKKKKKRGHSSFFACSASGRWVTCSHASHGPSVCRRRLLPRPEPGQRPRHRLPQGRRLPGLPHRDPRPRGRSADAAARLLSDAQPLPPGAVARRRRRPQPLDALADDGPRPAVPPPLPQRRPRLAGAVQGVPGPGGRAPADRAAVHRAEPAAGGPRTGRGRACTHRRPWRCRRACTPARCRDGTTGRRG